MTDPTTVHRRRALAAAALGRTPERPESPDGGQEPLRAVTGRILDASPHMIVVEAGNGTEERLVVAPWAVAWRGGDVPVTDLPAGTNVVMRTVHEGKVVDRIWADTTRITGTIVSIRPDGKDQLVELDAGPHRGRHTIVIPYRASGRLRVRHPKFEPGYLFDAIGVREGDVLSARLPATSQPPYRARAVPVPPPAYGGAQSRVAGTVTWSDAIPESGHRVESGRRARNGHRSTTDQYISGDGHGAAYPMLERSDSGCDDAGTSCAGLPYLALGSLLNVQNTCTGRAMSIPIVACGCLAGRFCDRCVECDTSPRGRIAEVSPVSFVELGGDLIKGCFNARIGLG
ncbi:hypothetical protein DP939_00670 [Spongiactinospora rosea]|uniref:Uncharacterized protein n=1 Tax=Spongiactinospora rosea TaxID=2248750 RepID=A0A366M509_9ACTN|nr:hypothetical protein [Spongiactinospora rosea]RBQ21275.1 hypothetical protein DP939_00670 [Spongiactinospora rosea]